MDFHCLRIILLLVATLCDVEDSMARYYWCVCVYVCVRMRVYGLHGAYNYYGLAHQISRSICQCQRL